MNETTQQNIVKITGATVEIKEALNWGDRESLKSTIQSGMKIFQNADEPGKQEVVFDTEAKLKATYKALQICIKKIVTDEGKEIPYTNEWMNSLSEEDGDKVVEAVNKLKTEKK